MRFELKGFFFAYSQKIDIPESFISPFSLEKLTRLFLEKEVNRGGSRIFLGGGSLVSRSTSTPINRIVFFEEYWLY